MEIINGRVLMVKSRRQFYLKEVANNTKSNTARSITGLIEDGYTIDDLKKCKIIEVLEVESGGCNRFRRNITDISIYEPWFIVSWG